jgi:hypothetical protein
MTKIATKTVSKPAATVTLEDLEFKVVQVTGGRKFPEGMKADCIKVGISKRYNRPYALLSVKGKKEFIDPKFLRIIGDMDKAKVALLQSEMETATNATLLVAGSIAEERENAVKFQHSGWYSPLWLPKSLISVICEVPETEESIYEVPEWKILSTRKEAGVEALKGLQDGYQKIVDDFEASLEAEKAAKPVVKPAVTASVVRKFKK